MPVTALWHSEPIRGLLRPSVGRAMQPDAVEPMGRVAASSSLEQELLATNGAARRTGAPRPA